MTSPNDVIDDVFERLHDEADLSDRDVLVDSATLREAASLIKTLREASRKPVMVSDAHAIWGLAHRVARHRMGFSGQVTDGLALRIVGYAPFIKDAEERGFAIRSSYNRVAKSAASTVGQVEAARKSMEQALETLVEELDAKHLGPTTGAPPAERGIDISGLSPAHSTQDKT